MKKLILQGLTCCYLIGSVIGLSPSITSAVQLRDGKVYFTQPPRLVKATTTFKSTYTWGATYYFTIQVPENAGEPLQKVIINQHEGFDNVRFDLDKTSAFEKNGSRKKNKLNIKDVKNSVFEGNLNKKRKTKAISITFDEPVSPGKTVVIALKPYQNPETEGIYLFGVTAYPNGENPHGQFLGFGRFHFYSDRF